MGFNQILSVVVVVFSCSFSFANYCVDVFPQSVREVSAPLDRIVSAASLSGERQLFSSWRTVLRGKDKDHRSTVLEDITDFLFSFKEGDLSAEPSVGQLQAEALRREIRSIVYGEKYLNHSGSHTSKLKNIDTFSELIGDLILRLDDTISLTTEAPYVEKNASS